MHRFATVALVTMLAVAACTGSSAPSAAGSAAIRREAPTVGGAEARRLVGAGALLLDVRTEEEFADGHIGGARNVPLDRLRSEMGGLPRDKPIVVYCAAGTRAAVAAQWLQAAGYDVRNLGPMSAWGF